MSEVKIVIPGRPVPYVRMTQRGKFVKSRAKKYLEYKNSIGWIAKTKIKTPTSASICITVKVYINGNKQGDADNYLKTAMDGLNKIAYIDDIQVIKASVEKIPCDKKEERMEIVIKEVI